MLIHVRLVEGIDTWADAKVNDPLTARAGVHTVISG
jgi:hypothetical protein